MHGTIERTEDAGQQAARERAQNSPRRLISPGGPGSLPPPHFHREAAKAAKVCWVVGGAITEVAPHQRPDKPSRPSRLRGGSRFCF